MTAPRKLVLLSDLHLGQAGAAGRDPESCLAAALDQIAAEHGDAATVIVLGDLSDAGRSEDYARLRSLAAALPMPLHLMLGNHDDRGRFRAVFGGAGPVQQQVTLGCGTPLYLLDTNDGGRDGGSLSDGRLDWLDAALAAADRPGFVFLHHPPVPTFAPLFDGIGLDDRAALAACLARHPGKVRAAIFGHCHMTLAGALAGVPALGLPSLCVQFRPRFDGPIFAGDPATPPGYGVLVFDDADFALHRLTLALPVPARG